MKVAVVGATGMVGNVMLKVLAERNFPIAELLPVASEKSVGKSIAYKDKEYTIISLEAAVAARLPDDSIYDRQTYDSSPNRAAFMYDDGLGNLIGAGSGRINYETGEVRFTALPNSEFVVSLIHKSAHAGGVNADTASGKNTIQAIGARCINSKLNTSIKILAYN